MLCPDCVCFSPRSVWSVLGWVSIFLYTYGILYDRSDFATDSGIALCTICLLLLFLLMCKICKDNRPNDRSMFGYLIIGFSTAVVLTISTYVSSNTIYIFAIIIATIAIIVRCIIGRTFPQQEPLYFWTMNIMLTSNAIGFVAVLSDYDVLGVLITMIGIDIIVQSIFTTYACQKLKDKGFWFTTVNSVFVCLMILKCFHYKQKIGDEAWKIIVFISEGSLCALYFWYLFLLPNNDEYQIVES